VDPTNQPAIEAPESDSAVVHAQATTPEPPPNWLLGEDGRLRAGWCLVVYYVLFRVFALVVGQLVFRLIPVGASRLWSYLGGESAAFLAAVLAALVMTQVDGYKFDEYSLPARRAFGKMFWIGGIWGMIAISVMLVIMHGANLFDFGHIVEHGVRMLKFGAFWAAFFLLVGLYEEFYFRGYFLFTLTRGLGALSGEERGRDAFSFWVAALLLCGYFGLIHLGNGGENPVGIAAAGCIGLFFCLTLRRTGNLWFAVGFHTTWDWAQSFLYSVPDSGTLAPGHLLSSSLRGPAWLSGGSVGPEGSVLVFVVIGVTAVLFAGVYRKSAPSG
jgi:uncharacterized protein